MSKRHDPFERVVRAALAYAATRRECDRLPAHRLCDGSAALFDQAYRAERELFAAVEHLPGPFTETARPGAFEGAQGQG